MGIKTFLYSDGATKKKKLLRWWHRNDWAKLHRPSLSQRMINEWKLYKNPNKFIVISGWLLKFYDSKESYMNWGDDINVYLMEKLTGKSILPNETLLFRKFHDNYLCIGSIIPGCVNSKSIIWGSGCLDFDSKMSIVPRKVCAVRGPKTREYLLSNGVECPEVYGDPALLLPLVYQPKDKNKKYKMTFIPHHRDFDEQALLDELLEKYPDSHLINMTKYDNWTDIIDEICQSERVLSSSLHGLIVSDAYGVPCEFCEFIYHHQKYDKYEDYYEAVGVDFTPPYSQKDFTTLIQSEWSHKEKVIDFQKLLDTCPLYVDRTQLLTDNKIKK